MTTDFGVVRAMSKRVSGSTNGLPRGEAATIAVVVCVVDVVGAEFLPGGLKSFLCLFSLPSLSCGFWAIVYARRWGEKRAEVEHGRRHASDMLYIRSRSHDRVDLEPRWHHQRRIHHRCRTSNVSPVPHPHAQAQNTFVQVLHCFIFPH